MKKLGEKVLWQRTRDYIRRYDPYIIGVTGSTGKTFTKLAISTLLADICEIRPVTYSHRTPLEVGLSIVGIKHPDSKIGWMRLLTKSFIREISRLEPDTIVVDLPADKPGNIDYLAHQIPFKMGVVTNVGSTHLRLYGDSVMVAHEKASLITSLPEDGYAFLNIDDPMVWGMRHDTRAKVISFGSDSAADVRLKRSQRMAGGGFIVEIVIDKKHYELSLPHIISRNHIYSILAALAVAKAMGGNVDRAAQNIRYIGPLPGQMNMLSGVNDSQIIDDSYSASPESMVAALHTLQALPAKRRIAILGDITDLGGRTSGMHQKIGKQVVALADIFIAVGDNMRVAQAEVLKSPRSMDTHHFDYSVDVGKWMIDHIREDDLILVKGSRDMKMEEVVRRLLANPKRDERKLVR